MKKMTGIVLSAVLALGVAMPAFADEVANPTNSAIYVDGERIAFEAYNINGNNYFKLRDIAQALSGSKAQFNVTWNSEAGVINLISGENYGENSALSVGDGLVKSAVLNTAPIMKDSGYVEMTAYNIAGNNFFKLRDLGEQFGFAVGWDGVANAVTIDTTEEVEEKVEEEKEETEKVDVVEFQGEYFYTSGMLRSEVQIEIAKVALQNTYLYENDKGEVWIKVDAFSLPKEVADAGWKVGVGAWLFPKDNPDWFMTTESDLDYVGNGVASSSMIYTSEFGEGGLRGEGMIHTPVKASEVSRASLHVRIFHKDYGNAVALLYFRSYSDYQSVFTGTYENASKNMKNETVYMDLSHCYEGLGL